MSGVHPGQKRQRYDSDSDVEEHTTEVKVVTDPSSLHTTNQPPAHASTVASPTPTGPAATKGKRRAGPAALAFARPSKTATAAGPPSVLATSAPTALSMIEKLKSQLKVSTVTSGALDEETLFNHGKQTHALDDAMGAPPKPKRNDSDSDSEDAGREASTRPHGSGGSSSGTPQQRPSSSTIGGLQSQGRSPRLKNAPTPLEDPSAKEVIRTFRSDDRVWARSLQSKGYANLRKSALLSSVVEYAGDGGFVDEDMGRGLHSAGDSTEVDVRMEAVAKAIRLDGLRSAHDRLGYRYERAVERLRAIEHSSAIVGFGEDSDATRNMAGDDVNSDMVAILMSEPFLAEYASQVRLGAIQFVASSSGALEPRCGVGAAGGFSIGDLRALYTTTIDEPKYTLGPLADSSQTGSPLNSPVNPSGPGELPTVTTLTVKDVLGIPVQQAPQEYEMAASTVGVERFSSGWRWDGIIRGNPRILDHYRPHQHAHPML